MRLTELMGALQPRRILGTADKNVRALKYRSDKCEAGDAFFALRGRDADGHDYLADAAARGADELSADEEFFGRTNLAERPEAFIGKIKAELADIAEYLAKPMGETARAELLARKERLEKVLL